MKRVAADLESDGLLPELTKIHCLWITDLDTGDRLDFADQPGHRPIIEGVRILEKADLIVGQNWLLFDHKALKKVYPWYSPKGRVLDTLVMARLFWSHIRDSDFKLFSKGKFPGNLIGSHSLEAWGHRLGNYKGDFKGPWDTWTPEMHAYGGQDVCVTVDLFNRCVKEAAAWGIPIEEASPPAGVDCIELEHRMAVICDLIEEHGFKVNEGKLHALTATLSSLHNELVKKVAELFTHKVVETAFTPKVNSVKLGYQKGVPTIKRKVIPFNPGSRRMVAERMTELGWQPTEFNQDGTPKLDDDTLESLPYPQAATLAKYFMIQKRLGQASNGNQAWLRHLRNGRIHGRINPGGTHTGRAAHSSPNMGQVPSCSAPFGPECRDLFEADEGHVLVGIDVDALELCDLAGYMARWDGGAYIRAVLEGDKALGTDMHSINARIIGCSRDIAKVFFYAMIYGAGDGKLGETLGYMGRQARMKGATARARLLKGVPALGRLVEAVKAALGSRGFLRGLDGRHLHARNVNAALNTLLQSAGAVQCKRWIVTLFDRLTAEGLKWGKDWSIVAWVHDEIQISCRPHLAEYISQAAVESIGAAGRFYDFRCPLTGQAGTGASWKETH